jgi:hypothetical protein
VPDGKVNVTDLDSKRLKAREGYIQGFNAQAVIDAGQLVVAAEISNSNVDWSQLDPMITATFTDVDRQHLYRIKYQQLDPDALDEEITAA